MIKRRYYQVMLKERMFSPRVDGWRSQSCRGCRFAHAAIESELKKLYVKSIEKVVQR
jgi:polyferredoxin